LYNIINISYNSIHVYVDWPHLQALAFLTTYLTFEPRSCIWSILPLPCILLFILFRSNFLGGRVLYAHQEII